VFVLARIGEKDRDRECCEALLVALNPVGLLTEDLNPVRGDLRGNFPQIYLSMVGIINGTVRLSALWDEAV
jgi:hypothetical protein